jgi:hypothetical protein
MVQQVVAYFHTHTNEQTNEIHKKEEFKSEFGKAAVFFFYSLLKQ